VALGESGRPGAGVYVNKFSCDSAATLEWTCRDKAPCIYELGSKEKDERRVELFLSEILIFL
jgi:hypothetical protein